MEIEYIQSFVVNKGDKDPMQEIVDLADEVIETQTRQERKYSGNQLTRTDPKSIRPNPFTASTTTPNILLKEQATKNYITTETWQNHTYIERKPNLFLFCCC